MISIKSVSTGNFIFINPWKALFGLKSPEKWQQFQSTGLLWRMNLAYICARNLRLSTQNLVYNGVNNGVTLLLASKTYRKSLKIYENQTMLEKRKYTSLVL